MTLAIFRSFGFLVATGALLMVTMPGSCIADVPRTSAPFAEQSAGKATRLSTADRKKIQHIINLQIKAFQRDDETIAFSYAAPETRKLFGSPRAFMEMVRSGYSALYRSESRQFLEAAVIDGAVIQPLRIVTPDGETLVALYSMQQQPDKEWRISGCEMAPSTLQVT